MLGCGCSRRVTACGVARRPARSTPSPPGCFRQRKPENSAVRELGKLLAFIRDGDHNDWLAERLKELDVGDIDAISAAIRAFP